MLNSPLSYKAFNYHFKKYHKTLYPLLWKKICVPYLTHLTRGDAPRKRTARFEIFVIWHVGLSTLWASMGTLNALWIILSPSSRVTDTPFVAMAITLFLPALKVTKIVMTYQICREKCVLQTTNRSHLPKMKTKYRPIFSSFSKNSDHYYFCL